VCNKCSIETVYNQQVISLCKICSENRELWKKSGAWFLRALPSRSNFSSSVKPSSSAVSSVTTKSDSISIDDDSSSDDRQSSSSRFNRRPSPSLAIPNNHHTTVNSYHNTHSIIEQDRDESIDSFKTDERSSKVSEHSIDDYIPKSHLHSSSQPPQPVSSSPLTSITTSSPTTIRPLSSVIINASSIIDDCGLGLLDFDIIWRESFNILAITLIRARCLRSADSNGLSDPYVKLHLIPGIAKATKLRSQTVHRTLNPDFDETLVYHGITSDDIKSKSLKFSVLDEDSVGADFLGEYRLKLSILKPDVREAYSVYLQPKTEDIEVIVIDWLVES
jgi:hypothetical protein